eukprot:TRINITY_DN528_c0_g1_i2.p1 TRINITY_DN528_c0_g1~~TRINITY_DN528_c0_g1_i2.p1  ORF type:complete len:146 (+),score=34.54 TRINITY_DN528_c0_g1_i2:960-1397(+)
MGDDSTIYEFGNSQAEEDAFTQLDFSNRQVLDMKSTEETTQNPQETIYECGNASAVNRDTPIDSHNRNTSSVEGDEGQVYSNGNSSEIGGLSGLEDRYTPVEPKKRDFLEGKANEVRRDVDDFVTSIFFFVSVKVQALVMSLEVD